jgi:hypothetical protein
MCGNAQTVFPSDGRVAKLHGGGVGYQLTGGTGVNVLRAVRLCVRCVRTNDGG